MSHGRIKGRGFRILAATAVATLVGVGSVLHASADTQVAAGNSTSGQLVDVICTNAHCLDLYANFNGANNNNDLKEAFTCVAVATPDAVATGITECQLETASGGSAQSASGVNLPGPTTTAAGTADFALSALAGGLKICYKAFAGFVDNNVVGPGLVQTNGGNEACSPPPIIQ